MAPNVVPRAPGGDYDHDIRYVEIPGEDDTILISSLEFSLATGFVSWVRHDCTC